jgi:hypothetical protein
VEGSFLSKPSKCPEYLVNRLSFRYHDLTHRRNLLRDLEMATAATCARTGRGSKAHRPNNIYIGAERLPAQQVVSTAPQLKGEFRPHS